MLGDASVCIPMWLSELFCEVNDNVVAVLHEPMKPRGGLMTCQKSHRGCQNPRTWESLGLGVTCVCRGLKWFGAGGVVRRVSYQPVVFFWSWLFHSLALCPEAGSLLQASVCTSITAVLTSGIFHIKTTFLSTADTYSWKIWYLRFIQNSTKAVKPWR